MTNHNDRSGKRIVFRDVEHLADALYAESWNKDSTVHAVFETLRDYDDEREACREAAVALARHAE